VIGSDTSFQHAFDVAGAHMSADVSMDRATFLGPAIFGFPPGDRPSVFLGNVHFALARFGGVTTFESARFIASSTFALARFSEGAIFSGGAFVGPSNFERSAYAGVADFRTEQFINVAHFDEAEFNGLADFSLAHFVGRAVFRRVRFATHGTFIGTQFTAPAPNNFSTMFDYGTSLGDLNFSSAQFVGRIDFRGVTASTMSLADATFFTRREAVFTNASANDLIMSVANADDAVESGDRVHVLELIESSAKSRNDLAVANDAHYDLATIASNGYPFPLGLLDRVFYGTIAGYLVRPFQPLFALILLASVFALLRIFKNRRSIWNVGAHLHGLLTEILNGLASIGPGSPTNPSTLGRRLEVFLYRLLVVCALIGFANSNPTLRQMLDALR
jgi:uncharacterized protein YjbI with pentapeptide repeats